MGESSHAAVAGHDDGSGATSADDESPRHHPLVHAMKDFLVATKGGAGQQLRHAVEDAAHIVVSLNSATAEGCPEAVADCHASLDQRLGMAETRAGELQPCVQALWSAAVASCSSSRRADEEVRLTREEVEELVLAYLVAYPDVLAPSLLKKLVQQLALGQSFMTSDDQHLDLSALTHGLHPHVMVVAIASRAAARRACELLQGRSESIAAKMLLALDDDRDGVVSEADFLATAPLAMTLELDNVVVPLAVRALMDAPDFADVFHPAMAAALGLAPADEGG